MGLCLGTKRRRPPSRWSSDLPPELLNLILCRLQSHADRLSFRAVCRHWRLAAQQHLSSSSPTALPWIRLDGLTFRSLPGGELRRFTAATVPRARTPLAFRSISADGWLKYEATDRARTCFLVNPFSGATIDVPTGGLDLDYLHCGNVWSHMLKMVVCSPDLIAAVFINGKVGFYRPGTPSWSAFRAHYSWYSICEAIAFYRGKLYVLTTTEELFAHDPAGHGKASVEHVIKRAQTTPATDHEGYMKSYLVASDDKLLKVKWSFQCSSGAKLKVFQADLEMGQWTEISSLDGQALFVSQQCSKAIRLSGNDPMFQGDRVYFVGFDCHCRYLDRSGCGDIPSYGFYDMRNRKMVRFFLKGGKENRYLFFSEWFFPCT